MGGVEELEKYLDENPSVAAAIEEYEDEEVIIFVYTYFMPWVLHQTEFEIYFMHTASNLQFIGGRKAQDVYLFISLYSKSVYPIFIFNH